MKNATTNNRSEIKSMIKSLTMAGSSFTSFEYVNNRLGSKRKNLSIKSVCAFINDAPYVSLSIFWSDERWYIEIALEGERGGRFSNKIVVTKTPDDFEYEIKD